MSNIEQESEAFRVKAHQAKFAIEEKIDNSAMFWSRTRQEFVKSINELDPKDLYDWFEINDAIAESLDEIAYDKDAYFKVIVVEPVAQ